MVSATRSMIEAHFLDPFIGKVDDIVLDLTKDKVIHIAFAFFVGFKLMSSTLLVGTAIGLGFAVLYLTTAVAKYIKYTEETKRLAQIEYQNGFRKTPPSESQEVRQPFLRKDNIFFPEEGDNFFPEEDVLSSRATPISEDPLSKFAEDKNASPEIGSIMTASAPFVVTVRLSGLASGEMKLPLYQPSL